MQPSTVGSNRLSHRHGRNHTLSLLRVRRRKGRAEYEAENPFVKGDME